MESPKIVYKYYSNPAFCGQSEVVFSQTTPCVTTKITPVKRMPPLGANSPRKIDIIDEPPELPPKPFKYQRDFRQSSMIVRPTTRIRARARSEDLEMAQFQMKRNTEEDKHRYEIIEDFDYSPTKKRIVEAETDEYNVDGPDDNEMKEVPTEIVKTVNGKTHRYAIVSTEEDEPRKLNVTFSPRMSQRNLVATQKLHELLSTPRKLKAYGSQPSVRITPNKRTPKKLVSSTPTRLTPSKSCANISMGSRNATSPISPKVSQKLNYGLDDVFVRNVRDRSVERSFEEEKRYSRRARESPRKDKTMAVIMPRLAELPSVTRYSEEIYSSWSSLKSSPATASLAIAALMMTICGGLTAGLSFYMMYSVGRKYYLDFGVLSGFTCLLLGILGFRTRRNQLLPNRNYISGYILLSSFAILSAIGILILLTMDPKPGTPLNDITSGAVCGLSVLSLAISSVGVFTSFCCKHPPPDNRVASARWF